MTARARLPLLAILLPAVLVVAALGAALVWSRLRGGARAGARPVAHRAPLADVARAARWLDGGPLTLDSLRGRVCVLVAWSDTDPRALAALGAAEAWHRAYARFGVRVVGVHAPEFSFAADPTVPERVARRLGLTLPIALDPELKIREGMEQSAAHAEILVADTVGDVVAASGLGRTTAVDGAIRAELGLRAPGARDPAELAAPGPSGDAGAPAVGGESRGAAEDGSGDHRVVYLGTARVGGGPLAHALPGRTETFTAEFRYQEDGEPLVPYPVGRWTPGAEGLTAARGGAASFVALRTDGGRVGAVLAPPAEGPARVWILSDDAWLPRGVRGDDVRADARGASYVEVTEPRLYAIATGDRGRVLKLSPEAPGVTLYGFTIDRAR